MSPHVQTTQSTVAIADALEPIVSSLPAEQLWWASGYIAGLAANAGSVQAYVAAPESARSVTPASDSTACTVLYGSQTGNAQSVAESLHGQLVKNGTAAGLHSLSEYSIDELAKERFVFVVISTQGEGDPPEDAELFWEDLHSELAPELARLSYAVLALGDSSYTYFCETGKQLDLRLKELGATRFLPCQECDLDFEAPASNWQRLVLDKTSELNVGDTEQVPTASVTPLHSTLPRADSQPIASATQTASIRRQQRITGRYSDQNVAHIELTCPDLHFAPGDSLNVHTTNSDEAVKRVLNATGHTGDEPVSLADIQVTLREALTSHLEITQITRSVVQQMAAYCAVSPEPILSENDEFTQYVSRRQFADFAYDHQVQLRAQELANALSPISTRAYSIASSPLAHPGQIHLTVALKKDAHNDNMNYGAASEALVTRFKPRDTLQVSIAKNSRFHLPTSPQVPIVLIGAGTGIAPYRAFAQHLARTQDQRPVWLIFGARTQREDFLYQDEWLKFREQNTQCKISCAFSRDSAEKVYVQQRLMEQGETFLQWLADGAVVYICGSIAMGKAVEQTIQTLLQDNQETMGLTWRELKFQKRIRKDVY